MLKFPETIKDKETCQAYVEKFVSESNLIEREKGEFDEGSRRAIDYLLQHYKWTPEIIEKAHGYLMQEKRLETKYKGKFRDCTVWIAGQKRENQLQIHNQVTDWIIQERQAIKDFKVQVNLHFDFEVIHPFADGNGRIGRLLYLVRTVQYDLSRRYFSDADQFHYYKAFEVLAEKDLHQYLLPFFYDSSKEIEKKD